MTAGGTVIAALEDGAPSGYLYAFDAETGAVQWTFEEPDGYQLPGSPTAVDGTVYVGAAGPRLWAIDAATGEGIWSAETDSSGVEAPTVLDGTVYASAGDRLLYAFDAETGDELWRTQPDASAGIQVTAPPHVVGGLAFVGSRYGGLYAVDAATGEILWNALDRQVASPLAWKGTVYAVQHGNTGFEEPATLYALNMDTGEQEWAFEGSKSYEAGAPPVLADGIVYFNNYNTREAGTPTIFAVDAETGEEVWSFTQPGGSDFVEAPTVHGGTVYAVGRKGTVWALDASTGDRNWKNDAPSCCPHTPTVYDGTVYVGDTSDRLYAIDASNGTTLWEHDTEQYWGLASAATVVADVETGDSVDSRVNEGSLGHHDGWASAARRDRDPANFAVGELSAPSEVRPGEEYRVAATVTNTGERTDEQAIEYVLADEVVASDAVSLDEGGSVDVQFTHSVTDQGEYQHAVRSRDDSASATLLVARETDSLTPSPTAADGTATATPTDTGKSPTVTESVGTPTEGVTPPSTDTPEDTEASAETPGFGIGAAVSGLGGLAYLVKRRIAGDSDDR